MRGRNQRKYLEGIELPAADVKVSAYGRDAEVVHAGLAEVAEHVGARLAVGLADEVGAVLVGVPQPLLALVPVHSAVVPSGD